MRMIAILAALLIVGLLIYKQMGTASAKQEVPTVSGSDTPQVPTDPKDVKQFETQMNDYMKDEAAKRAAAIEKAESQ